MKRQKLPTAFFQNCICQHSVPVVITSDQHKSLKSVFLAELTNLMGTKQLLTSSNWPQSNRKVEQVNSSILNVLRVLASKHQNWCELLSVVCNALNAGTNTSSGYSPLFSCSRCGTLNVGLVHHPGSISVRLWWRFCYTEPLTRAYLSLRGGDEKYCTNCRTI